MNLRSYVFTASGMCALVGFVAADAYLLPRAHAAPPGAMEAVHTAQHAPAYLRDTGTFSVSCGTTATAITWEDGYLDLRCWNTSSTAVYMGGTDVNTTHGRPICAGSACVGVEDVVRTQSRSCIVASGSTTIYCEGGS